MAAKIFYNIDHRSELDETGTSGSVQTVRPVRRRQVQKAVQVPTRQKLFLASLTKEFNKLVRFSRTSIVKDI